MLEGLLGQAIGEARTRNYDMLERDLHEATKEREWKPKVQGENMPITKLAMKLYVRIGALEDALQRALQVHGACLRAQQGKSHCSNLGIDKRNMCYVCHMRSAVEESE